MKIQKWMMQWSSIFVVLSNRQINYENESSTRKLPEFSTTFTCFCVQYYIENYPSNKCIKVHDVIYIVGLIFFLPDYWLTTDIQYRTSLELLNNGCLLRFTTLNILFVCKQTFSSKLNGHLLNVNCHNVLHQKLVLHWFGKYWCLQK